MNVPSTSTSCSQRHWPWAMGVREAVGRISIVQPQVPTDRSIDRTLRNDPWRCRIVAKHSVRLKLVERAVDRKNPRTTSLLYLQVFAMHFHLQPFATFNIHRVCPASGWLGIDGQTNSVKKYRIRLSIVNPSAVAGSERRSTARRIQNSSVHRYQSALRRLGTALDGQTNSVKKYRIRLAVVIDPL